MKVVVSAAGRGSRMLHLSRYQPKHLIKVLSKPFLYYLLINLKKAGFREIILVIGYQKEKMEQFIKDHKKFFNLTIVNQYERLPHKYGTACPLEAVEKFVGKENFVSVCGDNLYSVKDLKAIQIDDNYNYVVGIHYSQAHRYGKLLNKGEWLVNIVEKSKKVKSDFINTGLYKLTPEIFKVIKTLTPSSRGEYELTQAILKLVKQKKVKVKEIQDYWLDFGNPADIIHLSRFLKKSDL